MNLQSPIAETGRELPLALCDPSMLSPEARAARRNHLRSVHLETGVDPRCLTMPDGMSLWFVSLVLDLEVHAGCLGFTRHLYEYALGATEADAIEAVRQYFAAVAPEVAILSHKACLSRTVHPEELTFPEEVRRLDIPPSQQRLRGRP
jgi:hypothetical protein